MSAPSGAHRVALPVSAGVIGYALGYLLPAFAQLPNLYYDPLARGFLVGARPGPIPMGYLGQIGYGLACAAVAGLGTAGIVRLRPGAPRDSQLVLATAWTLTALLLAGAYFTWNNWP